MIRGNEFGSSKKGLSPVIATVLLITMVVVIGLIIFLWLRGLTQEKVTKFGGQNIEIVCDDVSFDAEYTSSGTLSLVNQGNIPIYGFKIKEVGDGSFSTTDLKELSSYWATNYTTGLNQGATFSDSAVTFTGSEIVVIPVLIGDSEQGRKTYTCDESLHGFIITL